MTQPENQPKHIVLIGAGIMSATLGVLLKELNPHYHISIYERLDQIAAESSDAWNNAGTGHSAFCELNYTPETESGSIDIKKAVKIPVSAVGYLDPEAADKVLKDGKADLVCFGRRLMADPEMPLKLAAGLPLCTVGQRVVDGCKLLGSHEHGVDIGGFQATVVAALEEIAYEYQKYSVQRLADRDVTDAELQRLLTRDNIDLDAVRAKVREAEAITTDVKIRMIEAVLKAVTTLTHEQHLKVMILIQELQPPKERAPSGRISEYE